MCNQCPTVGEFFCWIFRCGRCNNTCNCCEKKREDKCECKREDKCERHEKRFECVCQEKKEPECPCAKPEKKPCDSDCACKIY